MRSTPERSEVGYPFGGTRYTGGSATPTTYRFTGQRLEANIAGTTHGLYYYGARWYDVAIGRFISADTIVPSPGNPQSLNRYSYVYNNALKYTDPTGYFSKDEIDRYLEYQLGITSKDERERIINQWRFDDDGKWWKIIGPGGATYGDVLNGTTLTFWGVSWSEVEGTFGYDYEHNTFKFSGEEAILEMPAGMGALDYKDVNSLREFHDMATDIIWTRYSQDKGKWVYQGGTGYATGGAPIRWDKFGWSIMHTAGTGVAMCTAVPAAIAPEPTLATKALAVSAVVVAYGEVLQANAESIAFGRSITANRRCSALER